MVDLLEMIVATSGPAILNEFIFRPSIAYCGKGENGVSDRPFHVASRTCAETSSLPSISKRHKSVRFGGDNIEMLIGEAFSVCSDEDRGNLKGASAGVRVGSTLYVGKDKRSSLHQYWTSGYYTSDIFIRVEGRTEASEVKSVSTDLTSALYPDQERMQVGLYGDWGACEVTNATERFRNVLDHAVNSPDPGHKSALGSVSWDPSALFMAGIAPNVEMREKSA